MRRDLSRLGHQQFDLAVVGGGILGAFLARGAAARGLRTALVEKDDFASGTTSGSGKVLHGGIRYLQSLHFGLAREAQREQRGLAATAPDLVRPLPFLVPCRPGRLRERAVLTAGAWAWNGFRRVVREGMDLPPARYLGPDDVRDLAGTLGGSFGGGMIFHDVQLRSPERFTFEIVREAARAGAVVANYAEAGAILTTGGRVAGLKVRDRLDGRDLEIRAPRIVNAAGAWAPHVTEDVGGRFPDVALGRGIHVVVNRPEPPAALALPYRGRESANPAADGERRVFVMPWEGRTLVGASYEPFRGHPDDTEVSATEARDFLETLDVQWPGLGLDDARVLWAYSGLYPVFGRSEIPEGRYAASLRPLVLDHGSVGGPGGLWSVMSVKLSTARELAERVLDSMGADGSSPSGSARAAGPGPAGAKPGAGTIGPDDPVARLRDPEQLASVAELAARGEMAMTLPDVLFRRSWIGHLGHPGRRRLEEAAGAMGDALGWSGEEEERQVREAEERYRALEAANSAGDRRPARAEREETEGGRRKT